MEWKFWINCTYINQSVATIIPISAEGIPMIVKTTLWTAIGVAAGIGGAAKVAIVEDKLSIKIYKRLKSYAYTQHI